MTEPNHEQLEDLARRFGYEKKEAEAAYHLREAQRLFREIFVEDEERNFAILLFHETDAGALFRNLRRQLGMRVLRRNYPEGWGYVPPEDGEKED